MSVHYLQPSADLIIEAARPTRSDPWAELHASLAHDAELEEARSIVREGATYISPARLDAAIVTLRTGDAYDRFIAEELAGARAEQRARAYLDAMDDDHGEGHPAGAAAWFLGLALLFFLVVGALIFWVGTSRADRPGACEFMTASECVAWAQEQDGRP